MDPITHTLVGASLAATGLGERTRRAKTALIVGANLPDVDALAYFAGSDAALGLRRGWTHGIPALVVLPVFLVGCLWLLDRLRGGRGSDPAFRPGRLLAITYLAVATHLFLDFLNTYGIRLWMPFSDTWYYGDAAFIVDPWLWMVLGAGWLLGRRRAAWGGLAVAAVYISFLLSLHEITEARVAAELQREGIDPVERLMVGPVPVDPFTWEVVASQGTSYRVGRYSWLTADSLEVTQTVLPEARSTDAWSEIEAGGQIPGFRRWVRFPWIEVEAKGARRRVHVMDARYARERRSGFGTSTVTLEPDIE